MSFGFSGPVPGFSVETIAQPASELVSLADAKKQARIDYADDDSLFDVWRIAARKLVEREAATCFVPQTLRLSLPCWPGDGQLRLPIGPAIAVTLFKYYDSGGTLTALIDGVDYQTWLAYRPPLVVPYVQKFWPVIQFGKVPAIVLEYTAGTADPSELALARAATLMAIGYWSANRGDEEAPMKFGLPEGCLRLIRMLSTVGYR